MAAALLSPLLPPMRHRKAYLEGLLHYHGGKIKGIEGRGFNKHGGGNTHQEVTITGATQARRLCIKLSLIKVCIVPASQKRG